MAANTFPVGLRVLAVEPDRVCRKVLERQLTYCNYNATMVTNAQAALDLLRQRKGENQFDLVISNVAMPNMDGFKLLEVIGLEMDLPVIMLSANDETDTIVRGIKHGACDYIVKPVRLEQLRGIWKHVVKNSRTDPWNSIRSGDGDKVENIGANHTKRYSRKNKMVVDVADEDSENTPTQKKQRVKWCGELHQKFVQAIRQISINRAVPKKILEVMNVEGLTKENVASHLQKYRIYLRKLNEGTLSVTSFIGSPSSTNHFANTNSSSAIGMQASLPTESVQVGLPGASQCLTSGPSRSSFANSSNRVALNASRPFSVDIAGSSFANISNGSPPLTSNMSFSSAHSYSSYASILRGEIPGSSSGIPFEDISDGEMLAPSRHFPLQSPNLVNQPSVQLQSSSADLFNKFTSEVHQIAGPSNSWKPTVPSRMSDLGHNVGTSEDPSLDKIFNINPFSSFAGSSGQIPTFGNEYQENIPGTVWNTTPMEGFTDQLSAFSYGNNTHPTATLVGNFALASSSSTRPDLQLDNSAMPTQVLNGGGASDNPHVGSSRTVNKRAVSDQKNNINEFFMGTSEAQNGESDDLDYFLTHLDSVNIGDSFINGDWDFAP